MRKKTNQSSVPKDTSLIQIEFPHLKPIEQTIIKAFVENPNDANTDYFLRVVEEHMNFLKFLRVEKKVKPEIWGIVKDTVDTLYMLYEVKRPDHHILCSEMVH